MNAVIEKILEHKIIAIVRGVEEKHIVDLANALCEGGVKLIEVTFNQNDKDCITKTPALIKRIIDELGDKVCVGAGTVVTVEQCEAAIKAGAKYLISPNTDEKIIRRTKELGGISIPGALTPSEAVNAYSYGADFVKLFPAGDFGTGYIKSVCAPLNHIPFLAVGGVTEDNVSDFIKAGVKGVGVGSNLVNTKLINCGEFDKITEIAKKFCNA